MSKLTIKAIRYERTDGRTDANYRKALILTRTVIFISSAAGENEGRKYK